MALLFSVAVPTWAVGLVDQILPQCRPVDEQFGALAYFLNNSGEFQRSADNFSLGAGEWAVTSVDFKTRFARQPTSNTTFRVRFYTDGGGVPDLISCADNAASFSQIDTDTYRIVLADGEGCPLAGDAIYWVEILADNDEELKMEVQQVDSGDNTVWAYRDNAITQWVPADAAGRNVAGPDLCFRLNGSGPPVLLSPIPDQIATLNRPYLLDVGSYFEDPDGGAITYTISGLHAGLSHDPLTGIISGTPIEAGVRIITVTADGGASAQFNLNVRDKSTGQYAYSRLYPVITRPWHFNDVSGELDVAVRADQVLVGNPEFFRLDRMTLDGLPIRGQTVPSTQSSGVVKPHRLALDRDGNSYLSAFLENGTTVGGAVRKLDRNGNQVAQFVPASGTIRDVAVSDLGCPDGRGCVYVLTSSALLRYSKNANLLDSFSLLSGAGRVAVNDSGLIVLGSPTTIALYQEPTAPDFASAPAQITSISNDVSGTIGSNTDVALDSFGNILLATTSRLTALAKTHTLVSQGVTLPDPPGLFSAFGPLNLDANQRGDVYVYSSAGRIDRFKLDGDPVSGGQALYGARFSNRGANSRDLIDPADAVVDPGGNVYVVDAIKQTVQRFAANGTSSWVRDISQGALPSDHASFSVFLTAVNGIPLVGVLDDFLPNESFDLSFFIAASGVPYDSYTLAPALRSSYQQFSDVHGDGFGHFYIVATGNFGKFDIDGTELASYQASSDPACPIQSGARSDLSETGLLYVLGGSVLSAYSTDGECLADPVIYDATSLSGQVRSFAAAPDGSFAVSQTAGDFATPRIVKFDADGNEIGVQGGLGFFPDQYSAPIKIDFTGGDDLFVLDRNLRRVQRLNDTEVLNSDIRAVLVAGGGLYEGNLLWDETQAIVNYAYTVLRYLGLDRSRIQYLSSDTSLDLDGDGLANDVDGTATVANLNSAITTWAAGSDVLNIFLADHGDTNSFRMNPNEIMGASEFDGFLDSLQQGASFPDVRIIYEACKAGSFMDDLVGGFTGTQRLFIGSAGSSEDANFANGGFLSFSNQFWTRSLAGLDLEDAVEQAASSITGAFADQVPVVDANNDGVAGASESNSLNGLRLAASTSYSNPTPVLSSVSIPAVIAGNTGSLSVTATDTDGVARVWAVIQPPSFSSGDSNNPVLEMPTIDLLPVAPGSSSYQAQYDQFNSNGSYRVELYAQDTKGATSTAAAGGTVSVGGAFARRAILVHGGVSGDTHFITHQTNTELAYAGLVTQGYLDSDIQFLSNGPGTAVDAVASLAQISNAITTWAASATRDVVIYISGDVTGSSLRLNASEALTPTQLDGLLDTLGGTLPGTSVTILESDFSGLFLEGSSPVGGESRYFLSSASPTQAATLLNSGGFSFSQFFISAVVNGASLRDAFATASAGISFSASQTPLLDDNGNSAGNDPTDGLNAAGYFLGPGLIQAGNGPRLGSAPGDAVFTGSSYLLNVNDVTSTGTISRVFAVVTAPGAAVSSFDLASAGGTSYSGSLTGLDLAGDYGVSVYAEDSLGIVSTAQSLTIRRTDGGDAYEEDDVPADANVLFVGDPTPQLHNFDLGSDEDWLVFNSGTLANYQFTLDQNAGATAALTIEVFSAAGCEPLLVGCLTLEDSDSALAGADLNFTWSNTATNQSIYVRITSGNTNTGFYELSLFDASLPLTGLMRGVVSDASTGLPIAGAFISTTGNVDTFSSLTGNFLFADSPGSYSATISAEGYVDSSATPYSLGEAATTWLNVALNLDIIAPTVSSPGTSAVTKTSATLGATVDPMNESSTVEYRIYPQGDAPGGFLVADDSPISVAGAVSQNVSNLTCGSSYSFDFQASNSGGSDSASSSFSTPACDPPTITSAAAGSVGKTGATLNGSVDPNDFNVSSVRFAYGTTSGALGQFVAATPSSVSTADGVTPVSAAVSGFACGTTVYFRALGNSSAPGSPHTGLELSLSTLACESSMASTAAATAIDRSSASLSGSVNANDYNVSNLVFDYSTVSGALTQQVAATPGGVAAGAGATAVAGSLTALECGTQIYFALSGDSSEPAALDGGQLSFATLACIAPVASTSAASSIGRTSAVLNGSVNAGDSGAAAVTFDYGLTTAYGSSIAAEQSPLSGSGDTAVSAAISGLTCNTTYQFQVNASNATGSDSGGNLSFVTAACDTPIIDSVTAVTGISKTGASVDASVDPNGSDTSGLLFGYGTDSGNLSLTVAATPAAVTAVMGVSTVSVVLTGLECGTTYFVQLSGSNSDGAGSGPVESFATSPCDAATLATAAPGDVSSRSLTFNGLVTPNDFDVSALQFDYGTEAGNLPLNGVTTPAAVSSADDATAVSLMVDSLSCATTYYYQLSGTSSQSGGIMVSSGESSVTTAACVSAQITTGVAAPSGLAASLSGSVDPGDFTVSSIMFNYGLTSGALDQQTLATPSQVDAADGVSPVSAAVENLQCGQRYYFQASAISSASGSPMITGSELFFDTAACNEPVLVTGTPPTGITAAGATLGGMVTPNSFDVTAIEFAYGTAPGTLSAQVAASPASVFQGQGTTSVSAAVSSLDCGTTYYFQLQGLSSASGSPQVTGLERSFATADCIAPTATTSPATDRRQTAARLNAQVNPNGADTTVNFEYGLTQSYGDTAAVTGAVTGSDLQDVFVDISGLSCGSEYQFRAVATSSFGSTAGSNLTFSTLSCASILLVDDDDNAPDLGSVYTAALDSAGATYDVLDLSAGSAEPDLDNLASYRTVLWFTGNDSSVNTGPSATAEVALSSFLENGPACLMISSQNYFTVRGPSALMQGYLGLGSGTSNSGDSLVSGASADFSALPATGQYSLQFSAGLSNAVDSLVPNGQGLVAFAGNAGSIAIQVRAPGYNSLQLGFPFAAIPGAVEQGVVMGAIVDYCADVDLIHGDGFEE